MNVNYSMNLPHKVVAGMDSIDTLPAMVSALGLKKVLILTDPGVWGAGLVERPKRLLNEKGIKTDVIHTVVPEPEARHIMELYRQALGLDIEGIIGMGGGSAMDAAKLVSVLLTNRCDIEELIGTERVKLRGLPTLMIPTTAGTGSEATQNAIVTIPEQELKVGVVSSKLLPDCVVLDPGMTVKLPQSVTASTGMDAFTHALECYISKKANPLSDTFALRAIQLIYGSILRAYTDGSDLQAREDMLLGSFFGGLSIAASGTAAVHALAYPLGGKYKIPHGVSNAMLLAHVTEFNADAVPDKLKDIGVAMGICRVEAMPEIAANQVIECLHTLAGNLKIPTSLRPYGINEEDLPALARAASGVTRLLDNNPKPLAFDDMIRIYRKLL